MQLSRFLNEIPQEYIHPLHEKAPVFTEDGLAEFAPGDTVHHRDFGAGIVQRTYNTSMGLTYDVFFPQSHITRSLVGKYAKLYRS